MRVGRWSQCGAVLGLCLATCLCGPPAPQPVQEAVPPGSYAVARQPYAVRLGDVDGDGVSDAVTASLEEHALTLLAGGQPGRPAWRLDLPTGGMTLATALGDLNGDGRLDLLGAVHAAPGHVALFLGRAGGVRLPGSRVRLEGAPHDLAVADLDGDGRAEVLVAVKPESLAVIHDADRRPRVRTISLPGCGGGRSYGPDGVTLGQWDGDAFLDLAVACYGAWTVQILPGLEGGGFGAPAQVAAVAGPEVQRIRAAVDPASLDADPSLGGLRKVRLADLDQDGRMDMAAVGDWGILLLAFGTGATRVVATGVDGSNDLAVGDINGNGMPEILLTSGHENRLVVLGSTDWRDAPLAVVRVGVAPASPESLVLQDLDGDGALDLALAGQRGHAVQFLRGDGVGGFAPFSPREERAP